MHEVKVKCNVCEKISSHMVKSHLQDEMFGEKKGKSHSEVWIKEETLSLSEHSQGHSKHFSHINEIQLDQQQQQKTNKPPISIFSIVKQLNFSTPAK